MPRKITYIIAATILMLAVIVTLSSRNTRNAYTNAVYIVHHNNSDERIEADLKRLGVTIAANLDESLADFGGRIVDPDEFAAAIVGETLEQVLNLSRSRSVELYMEVFDAGVLAKVAAYYKSDSGQAVLAHVPRPTVLNGTITWPEDQEAWLDSLTSDQLKDFVAFAESPSGQALQNAEPTLTQFANQMLPEFEAVVEENITLVGTIELLDREDLVEFDDPKQRENLLKELRSSVN